MPDDSKFLTVREAAEYLSLSESTLKRWAWLRQIRTFKIGGAVRFRKSDLEERIIERPPIEEVAT